MRIAFCLFAIGIFCLKLSDGLSVNSNSSPMGEAVQILEPDNNGSFQLNRDVLKIFDKDDIKDRQVVAVSIAGAYRTGKSFILNFFLKYLYANVSL